ncbi:MAG: manganese efflux pump [Spirochaetales bacterium]|nr:manganese efflux pump [Spirochaetales bacterium]
MEFITILGIAFSLAMDAFSVCVAAGTTISGPTFRHYFRFSWHFGLFQFLMPVIGYYCGVLIADIIKHYDHWIALVLLSAIGIKMIWESFKKDDGNGNGGKDPSRGFTLILLSIATSIDAAAAGLSLAAMSIPVLFPALIIGTVCIFCSAFGLFLGNRLGLKIGKWAERFGGLVLVLIGVRICLEHLLQECRP